MVTRSLSSFRRSVALVVAGALAVAGAAVMSSAPALADTAPATGTPATVSADALPTIQINGVVWSQTMIGNTVYATGEFSTVRPPGVAAGGPGEAPVSNIVAYDIRTGQQVTTFAASLNAQGMTITSSPDGSRLYVGGDFTAVNGQPRSHVVALDPTTGAVIPSFAASIDGRVRALSVTPTTVYAGGEFQSANGAARGRLAAFNVSNGAMLPWAPTASDGYVWAVLALPDRGKVIVGGQMKTLSGSIVNGMGAVDITSGAVQPWAANTKIIDHTNGAIISLKYDGSQVYGSGFAFGTGGQFEGTFGLNPDTGAINVINDCHGDTYDVMPIGQVLYSVSHVHGCDYQGGFPSSNPWSINQHNQLAQTTYPVNKNTGPDDYGWNYAGLPSSQNLHWYPDFIWGNYTPSGQASWSVTGNSDYIALGGEFRGVNGVAQQGLTRFAIKDKATNKQGPMVTSTTPAPVAKSGISGTARISWQALADRDNTNLTYEVLRSGNATPVYTTTQASSFWQKPAMGYTDRGLTPGATYTYTVRVKDPLGNTATLTTNAVTISTDQVGDYAQDVVNDGANYYWRLGESAGPTLADSLGSGDLKATSGLTYGQTGALNNDTNRAIRFSGSNAFASTQTAELAPNLFTVEAWVKTTSLSGGKIIGFGNAKTGNSTSYDRHLYLDSSGYVNFGVYNGSTYIARSTSRINDGNWHQVLGTLDANGVSLYVDGVRVARNAGTTTGEPTVGYWRVGGDSTWSGNRYLAGTIDEVAVYPTSLTLNQIQKHYRDSGRTLAGVPNVPPTAAFTNTAQGLKVSVDGSSSTDDDGTIASYAWNWGDGTAAGSGATASHTYAAAGTYTVTLTVTDDQGATNTTTRSVTVTNTAPTAAFTTDANALALSVDGSGSSDADGTIAAYSWNWGDGTAAGSGATANHTYAAAGTYTVTLTVTDNAGGTDTASKSVTVAKANQAPTASFTATTSDLKASVDGSGSSDPDGTIAAYSWNWGDGTAAGSGATTTHTYAAAGTYTVTLTVTDNNGATDTTTKSVTVTAPPVQFLAQDSFGRTVTGGWGSADQGGAWSLSSSASAFSVSGGTGRFTADKGAGAFAALRSVSATDLDTTVEVSMSPRPDGNAYISVIGRGNLTDAYRAKLQVPTTGAASLYLVKVVGGTETTLSGTSLPGVVFASGDTVVVRIQVQGTGPTTLRAKAWESGTTEPAAWQTTTTDSTASLQVAGGVGVGFFLSSLATTVPMAFTVDNLVSKPVAG
jgi:PKD repeat protein